jgi:type IV pilus assembly protein PilV
MKRHEDMSADRSPRGFTIVEMMVALIILSVGLLGVARLQSLALSSTSVAAQRSLAAIEASSLAAAMHENRGYWINSDPAGATISVQGTTFTYTNGAAALSAAMPGTSTTGSCVTPLTPCTPTALAAVDLLKWATTLSGLLPGSLSTIACGTVSPVSCTITITWAENAVAINAQLATAENTRIQANSAVASLQNPTYTLYVEP